MTAVVDTFLNHPAASRWTWPFKRAERDFISRTIHPVSSLAPLLASGYLTTIKGKGETHVTANRQLREHVAKCWVDDLNISWSDERLDLWCKVKARQGSKYLLDIRKAEENVLGGLSFLPTIIAAAEYVAPYGINLWPMLKEFGIEPLFLRLGDCNWWRRRARRIQGQHIEALAILLERVRKDRECYCSDTLLKRRHSQRRRNAALLEALEMVNEDGERFSVAELAETSEANPKNRHASLMVRMRGFQTVADVFEHAGEFWTLTCPGFMHPCRVVNDGKTVIRNPKWDGSTPADQQRHLCKVWSKIRAKLARKGIRVYGFRVAEAHHDGSVHWHFGLHMEEGQVETARLIAREYALEVEPEELGADKHRFVSEAVDRSRGDVPGYLAKYVSKNILSDDAAAAVGQDLLGNDSAESMYRVEAWASCWRIRQFQQIGGPSVQTWRELRRAAADEVCQLDFSMEASSNTPSLPPPPAIGPRTALSWAVRQFAVMTSR